jgi:hypothetical protein
MSRKPRIGEADFTIEMFLTAAAEELRDAIARHNQADDRAAIISDTMKVWDASPDFIKNRWADALAKYFALKGINPKTPEIILKARYDMAMESQHFLIEHENFLGHVFAPLRQ